MNWQNDLTRLLGIEYGIIQAPLGGGPGTPELSAAVSEAGGIGSLAGAYLSVEELGSAIQKTKRLTSKPFFVNLFVPSATPSLSEASVLAATMATREYREELGLPPPEVKNSPFAGFDRQMEVIYRERPRAFSFTFGIPEKKYLEECARLGILTMGTATSPREAHLLRESGVDAICLQGCEAGGHRGMFSVEEEDPQIGALELLETCRRAISVPLAVAGGLMRGADVARVLRAGAQAAQLGTAFLLCPETKTSGPYRDALGKKTSTRLTRVFSGRLARGIENKFMSEMEGRALLPWPAQNAFTRDIRTRSVQIGRSDYLSLWAGMGFHQIREMPAGELVEKLAREAEEAGTTAR